MTDIFNTLITMADIGMNVKEVMRIFVSSKLLRGPKFTLSWKRYRSPNGSCTSKILLGIGGIRDKIRSLKIFKDRIGIVVEMFNDIFPRNNCIWEETVHMPKYKLKCSLYNKEVYKLKCSDITKKFTNSNVLYITKKFTNSNVLI